MRKMLYLSLLFLIGALLAGCSDDVSSSAPKPNHWYPVSGYIDGDTFKIKTGKTETTVRLLYVDAPKAENFETVARQYSERAADFTKQLLADSQEVRLTFDKEPTDAYGHSLAIVELKDGSILNELLLEEGLAKVLIVEPNVKMENVYKQREQQAKQAGLGIWSTGTETSHADVPVKKAMPSGITIQVDKKAERATITNNTDKTIALEGWKLVSVRDNQTYTFESYDLKPNGQVIVASGHNRTKDSEDVLIWEADEIWHDFEADPAELYNEFNDLIAVWEDK